MKTCGGYNDISVNGKGGFNLMVGIHIGESIVVDGTFAVTVHLDIDNMAAGIWCDIESLISTIVNNYGS